MDQKKYQKDLKKWNIKNKSKIDKNNDFKTNMKNKFNNKYKK